MRSQLGRVRGLGAAKSGVGHWWGQRLSALALIPLSLWFVASVLHLLGASHDAMLAWANGPVTIVLLICLVLATFYHLQLGLQVVIEDYIHQDAARLALLIAIKGAAVVLALACIVSVLRIGL
ncbi:MAG: succinate dehydrogenase, hydrophobic membrane anchor protein [Proteobacteria bacterium]|nr:succinate dehydrogenase, hydrophobic membrane anchor protein [Pseudomonadota bacterium]